jgi:hypothetical protein
MTIDEFPGVHVSPESQNLARSGRATYALAEITDGINKKIIFYAAASGDNFKELSFRIEPYRWTAKRLGTGSVSVLRVGRMIVLSDHASEEVANIAAKTLSLRSAKLWPNRRIEIS